MAAKCDVWPTAERKRSQRRKKKTLIQPNERWVGYYESLLSGRAETTDIPPDKTHSHCGCQLSIFSALSAVFAVSTFRGHLTENTDTYFSLYILSVSLTLSHWWVVREGLSALLYKLCFNSLLEATGSAFKYSHLTHPNRGS